MATNNQRVVWTKAVQKRCKSLDVLREIRTQRPGEQNRPGCAACSTAAARARCRLGPPLVPGPCNLQTLCRLCADWPRPTLSRLQVTMSWKHKLKILIFKEVKMFLMKSTIKHIQLSLIGITFIFLMTGFSLKLSNCPLLDPMFFQSDVKFGGRKSLLGSGIIGLTEGCPGKVFGWYPWNSVSLLKATR